MTLQDKSEVLHCLQNLGNEWTFCDMVSFNRKHMIPGFMNSFFFTSSSEYVQDERLVRSTPVMQPSMAK